MLSHKCRLIVTTVCYATMLCDTTVILYWPCRPCTVGLKPCPSANDTKPRPSQTGRRSRPDAFMHLPAQCILPEVDPSTGCDQLCCLQAQASRAVPLCRQLQCAVP